MVVIIRSPGPLRRPVFRQLSWRDWSAAMNLRTPRLADMVPEQPASTGGWQRRNVLLLGVLACLAALALHAPSIARPMILRDDFPILVDSWTWEDATRNLWVPFNEHVMPLGRLSTWALVQLAGAPTGLPLAAALQGPLAVLVGMWLVFAFVGRECGRPFPALAAMALFGVSTVYAEAVCWFAASFAVLALDTLLLALLAAQHWRDTGSRLALTLSALMAALAPAWFASGILAGPLCCLYLLPPADSRRVSGRHLLLALVPSLGSVVFLAVSLPRTAHHIMHLDHYAGQTALEAFHPLTGLLNTGRSLMDNLIPGIIGISGIVLPLGVVAAGLIGLAVAAAWWWRRASRPRLLLLGLGLILTSYPLIYSARSQWSYEAQTHFWTRYHLFPQLGLTLFLCGGPRAGEAAPSASTLTRRQTRLLLLLTMGLLIVQFPRGLLLAPSYDPEQRRLFALIGAVDARCRAHHVSAATARQALDRLPVPWWDDEANGWVLLRGSDSPRNVSPEEARRLLKP